ncbi:hypothetical protein HK099_000873 [Clydaea vesicula]|uniref:Uncharacterized protein n=1 Tax=Clydaea vesicula TaxID=447962 RepID=A0AAD5TUL9_9FUNG|nr:hypothetical protein HK099_000873 [Clydaea vesicula]
MSTNNLVNEKLDDEGLITYTGSKSNLSKRKAKKISKEIDEELKRELEREIEKGRKLLILGSGDSGKSTLLRQMRLLYSTGFDEKEKLDYKFIIFKNILTNLHKLIFVAEKLNFNFNKQQIEIIQKIKTFENEFSGEIPPSIFSAIMELWAEGKLKELIKVNNEYNIQDTASYFLDNISRLMKSDYIPTDQDIICSRKPTLVITETVIKIQADLYRIYGKKN